MKNQLRIIFLIISLFSIYSQNLGSVYEYKYSPSTSIDPLGSAHYKIYIPDSMNIIKGVYCYLPGINGNSLNIVNDTIYQNFVEERSFALMGFEMLGNYTNNYSGVTLWSGEALIYALKELSIISGHSQLQFSPLLFDGHSAGGQFAYHFTQWKPERVIAFVTMKGGVHSEVPAGDAINVPGFMFIGENDLDYRITNLTSIFEMHRPIGARWALAIEPDAGHTRISEKIVHLFFDQIIKLRLTELSSTDTIPGLVEIEEENGWLGDRVGFNTIQHYSDYYADKSVACWFANKSIAIAWKEFIQGKPITGAKFHNPKIHEKFILSQNYPNPFNPNTTINYSIPEQSNVTLKVYDLLGSEVITLINKVQPQGNNEVEFDGNELTSGIYFYRIQAGDFVETKKMILIK